MAEHLSRRLPVYALPIFVRFCRALDATETFKQNKEVEVLVATDAAGEGINQRE